MGAYNDLMRRAQQQARKLCESEGMRPYDGQVRSEADALTPTNITALTELLADEPHLWWITPDMEDVEMSPGKVLQVILYETLINEMEQEIDAWVQELEESEEDNG